MRRFFHTRVDESGRNVEDVLNIILIASFLRWLLRCFGRGEWGGDCLVRWWGEGNKTLNKNYRNIQLLTLNANMLTRSNRLVYKKQQIKKPILKYQEYYTNPQSSGSFTDRAKRIATSIQPRQKQWHKKSDRMLQDYAPIPSWSTFYPRSHSSRKKIERL